MKFRLVEKFINEADEKLDKNVLNGISDMLDKEVLSVLTDLLDDTELIEKAKNEIESAKDDSVITDFLDVIEMLEEDIEKAQKDYDYFAPHISELHTIIYNILLLDTEENKIEYTNLLNSKPVELYNNMIKKIQATIDAESDILSLLATDLAKTAANSNEYLEYKVSQRGARVIDSLLKIFNPLLEKYKSLRLPTFETLLADYKETLNKLRAQIAEKEKLKLTAIENRQKNLKDLQSGVHDADFSANWQKSTNDQKYATAGKLISNMLRGVTV